MQKNFSLKNHNTFGIDVIAENFFEYDTNSDIINFIDNNYIFQKKFLVLGSGSNILFTRDYDGLIIHPKTKGIKVISENGDKIELEVAAGEIWDDFVLWAVNNNYYGIENLSNIPGTVGASVIQNIGAYGAEVSDVVTRVKYIDTADGELSYKNNFQCKFGYRNSIFKGRLKSRTIILSVNFELKKISQLNLKYADVAEKISKHNAPGLKEMRETIIEIRNSKLPDPAIIGNAGSFFKNPIVDNITFNRIQADFPDVKFFHDNPPIQYKIAAAWLIDKCLLKGFEYNGAAVHENQPLVLVNKNNASGKDIYELSKMVQNKVFRKFGIMLEPEVMII